MPGCSRTVVVIPLLDCPACSCSNMEETPFLLRWAYGMLLTCVTCTYRLASRLRRGRYSTGCSHDQLDIFRREKLRDGCRPFGEAKEAVRLLLLPLPGRKELLPFRQERLHGGTLSIVLIEGQRSIVTLLFVSGQCFFQGSSSRQSCIDGLDGQFHIPEGIHDALCCIGVLVIAGVADECPARAIRLAEEIGQISRVNKALLLLALTDSLGKPWCEVEGLEEVSCNAGTDGMKLGDGPGDVDERKLLVGGKGDDHAARPEIDFRSRESHAAPVAIVGARQHGFGLVGWSLHAPCNERTHAIGPNHDPCLLFHAATAWMPPLDARHPVAAPQDLLDEEAFAQFGTCFHGSINEYLIQDGTPWSIDRSDTLDRRRRAYKSEWAEINSKFGNGWTMRGDDLVQYDPALQPRDTGLADEVGGYGVTGERGFVDQ